MESEPLIRIDDWCLVSADKVGINDRGLLGGITLVSFMWHECEALKFEYGDLVNTKKECEINYLDSEDSIMGRCWYCLERAPHDLHTMWIIHNMNFISALDSSNDVAWEPVYLEERKADIIKLKKAARKAGGYDG